MKKKIVIGLSLFSLIFFVGGIYIIVTIERTTSTLDKLITLHQVEILREHLMIHIKKVQADITLRNTRHARDLETVVRDVDGMCHLVKGCMGCHHSEDVTRRLSHLKEHVDRYTGMVSRVFTIRANAGRLAEEQERAFAEGEQIVRDVSDMITMASMKLEERTNAAMKVIGNTKYILFGLVGLAPVLATGLGFVFIRAFTKPLNTVLNATRRLRSGDLDHRIEGLKDECGEVAASFNEMAASLKEHLRKIEESEKRYRTLFETAGDAIFILEAEGTSPGRIVAANQAAARMHGYTVEELLQLNIVDLDSPDDAHQAGGRIKRILGGEWINVEMNHLRKDGAVFPVEVSAGLLKVGGHNYVLAIDRDITERKRAEDALQRAEQMKTVGELAAGLAHEIKNPLAGIKTSMEVLSGEAQLPQEDREVLLKVVGEIRRIESLMKSLLNFARPPVPQLSQVDVNAIVDTAFAITHRDGYPPEEEDRLVVEKAFGALPQTVADPMQLKQVFLNLLLNAADAMPRGGLLRVKTSHDPERDLIQVEVSDTGGGIREEDLDKVFRPFFSTKAKGTGLGLAITKRLVEAHDGAISISSVPGKGATFTVTLPVRHEGTREK